MTYSKQVCSRDYKQKIMQNAGCEMLVSLRLCSSNDRGCQRGLFSFVKIVNSKLAFDAASYGRKRIVGIVAISQAKARRSCCVNERVGCTQGRKQVLRSCFRCGIGKGHDTRVSNKKHSDWRSQTRLAMREVW